MAGSGTALRHLKPSFHALWTLALLTLACRCSPAGPLDSLVDQAVAGALVHLERSVEEVGDTTLYPSYGTPELRWKLTSSRDWTSGFYPGCLWYAYELSRDRRFKLWAEQWTATLEPEKFDSGTHDLGFKFMCSFGNELRLEKNPARRGVKAILLQAAGTLAERYDPAIGALESNWDRAVIKNSFPVIIDIMMNLDLLFWASEHGGPSSFAADARRHAETTCRDFLRPDGSTYHIVRYDRSSGKMIGRGTLQGAGDETTWSRGQAWGMYGMEVAYRYTREKKFLEAAVRMSDYFLNHLRPDHIAPWDFQSDDTTRDVSASCIAASALLALVRDVHADSLKGRYTRDAEAIITSLCRPPYFTGGRSASCILDHATQYLPIHSNVDVPAIFADYYFLEALVRYRGLRHPPG